MKEGGREGGKGGRREGRREREGSRRHKYTSVTSEERQQQRKGSGCEKVKCKTKGDGKRRRREIERGRRRRHNDANKKRCTGPCERANCIEVSCGLEYVQFLLSNVLHLALERNLPCI